MKKKIAILGSTGSIGKTLIKLLESNNKKFEIVLLTANQNYKTLLKQSKHLNVKNIIIKNKSSYEILKTQTKRSTIKIFNNFDQLDKILPKKIDYVMSSITGIEGLEPTIKIIKHTKKIAIANKESIICGWSLINKELKKNKTEFIPVDSEHFSIWFAIKNNNPNKMEKIYLTASGGSLYDTSISRFKKVSKEKVLNHPNWKMGKKISIDSATMINKVYEVIEAKNIFQMLYKNIEILIHPKSYVHALMKFNNGLIKIIAHDTTMKIPIFNTLFDNEDYAFPTSKINIKNLNDLNFQKVDLLKYPMVKLINLLPQKHSLFETIIVSANDTLVDLFLRDKIKFLEIHKELFKLIKNKEFSKYKNKKPTKLKEIIGLNNYVSTKIKKKYTNFK